jgi:pimeloyl-ACP methyl ester carboxylesterase
MDYWVKRNKPSVASNAKARKYLVQILENSNLVEGIDFTQSEVQLETLPGYIYTITGGAPDKPILVLLHGFGSPMGWWVKMFPRLFCHFRVYAFDHYGMGCSYRFEFKLNSPEDAVAVYTKAIEEWRANLNLENFYVCGHSLGGFLAAHWIQRFSPKVKGIFMLSAAGVTNCSTKQRKIEMNQIRNPNTGKAFNGFALTLMKGVLHIIQEWHVSPYSFLKFGGKDKQVKKYFSNPKYKLTESQIQIFKEYFKCMISETSDGGEKYLGYFLKWGRYAQFPFGDFLPTLGTKYPFLFMYGDEDWMVNETFDRVLADCSKFFLNNGYLRGS